MVRYLLAWALVPLWVAVAPYVFYRLYRRKAGVR